MWKLATMEEKMPGRKVCQSLRQRHEPVPEPVMSNPRRRAVFFDDGDPHLLGADDESEVPYADFGLEPSDELDQVIIH